jgi:hypothetical protein
MGNGNGDGEDGDEGSHDGHEQRYTPPVPTSTPSASATPSTPIAQPSLAEHYVYHPEDGAGSPSAASNGFALGYWQTAKRDLLPRPPEAGYPGRLLQRYTPRAVCLPPDCCAEAVVLYPQEEGSDCTAYWCVLTLTARSMIKLMSVLRSISEDLAHRLRVGNRQT